MTPEKVAARLFQYGGENCVGCVTESPERGVSTCPLQISEGGVPARATEWIVACLRRYAERLVRAAVEAEREACATLVESVASRGADVSDGARDRIAEAIRRRAAP